MSIEIKSDLSNTLAIAKNLSTIEKGLGVIAKDMATQIKVLWDAGRGGDSTNLKKYSKKYGEWKEAKTGSDKVNLTLRGHMRRDFDAKKETQTSYALTFSDGEMGKAKGNYNKRPNMLEVSQKLVDQATIKLFKYLMSHTA